MRNNLIEAYPPIYVRAINGEWAEICNYGNDILVTWAFVDHPVAGRLV